MQRTIILDEANVVPRFAATDEDTRYTGTGATPGEALRDLARIFDERLPAPRVADDSDKQQPMWGKT